ncbi:hypothetical protein LUX33_01165 [Actinomadura madurae]|uniref:hypothetical protein n=1 Tax=Actinomadura madurae TaxID=1993 RepID=UPI0020D251B6|nr:hypothetical protein [Actinomadura madurae]MCP9947203.1 hypothetical protein [Actinomadura madurae]
MSTDPFPEVFAAVPDWMTKASAWTPQELRDACEDAADVISSGGDQLLYGSPPPACRRKNTDLPPEPTVEDIADALARGLGILAHAPGGVTALHRHWCASPHDDCPGPGTGRCYDIGGRAGSGAFYTPARWPSRSPTGRWRRWSTSRARCKPATRRSGGCGRRRRSSP